MSYEIERLTADVLVIGGGLAGCTAALQAREEGASVILLEAGNTFRSGNAGSGLDHIFSYVPEVHEKVGYTKDDMKKDMVMFSLLEKGFGYPKLGHLFVDTSYERVYKKLSAIGVGFDAKNRHLVNGIRLVPQWQSVPTSYNYEGRDVKVCLTNAMLKAGVEIVNRAEAVRILRSKDGKCAGAIALSTREDKLIVVTAKATVLATNGGADRLTESGVTTNRNFKHPSATTSGAGIALPIRAGADVVNLELAIKNGGMTFNGFQFTVGTPGGSWWPAGRLVDDDGNVIVERSKEYDLDEPDYVKKNQADYKKYYEQKAKASELLKQGVQLYMDLSEATDEEIEQITFALRNEGMMGLWLDNLEHEGLTLKEIKVPLKYEERVIIGGSDAGVFVDEHLETTLPNLYAAGDVTGAIGNGFAPGAVVYGFESGLQAGTRAKEIAELPAWEEAQLEEVKRQAESIRAEEDGYTWADVEREIRSIVGQFARFPLTDGKIESALKLLHKIREKHHLQAEDPYDLSKAFEVLFLLDSAEALFEAAKYREESIFGFRRVHNGEEKKADKKEIYGVHFDEAGKLVHTVHENGFPDDYTPECAFTNPGARF